MKKHSSSPFYRQKNFDVLIAIITLCVIGFFFVFLKNPLALDDGLRHLAMARVYAQSGAAATGGWSVFFYEGLLAHLNTDPWLLFDVLLMPVAPLSTVLALKLVSLFSLAALIASFIFTLRGLKVSPALSSICIVLLVFGHTAFSQRLLIARPFVLITAIAVFVLGCTLQRRFVWQGIALGIALLLSQLFVFPFMIALAGIIWFVALREWQSVLKSAASIAIGLLSSLSFHVHPVAYVHYLFFIFLRIPFLKNIGLGGEMQSGIGSGEIIIVLIGLLILLQTIALQHKHLSRNILLSSGLVLTESITIIFTCVFVIWARGVDILWPFLLLSIAHLLSTVPASVVARLIGFIPVRARRPLLVLCLLLLIARNGALGYSLLRDDPSKSISPIAHDLSMIAPEAHVLNVDWDFVPIFISLRSDLQYATGIDPSFTYLTDPQAFSLLHQTFDDSWQKNVSSQSVTVWLDALLAQYPSDYFILASKRHEKLIDALAGSAHLQKISDERAMVTVFRIEKAK